MSSKMVRQIKLKTKQVKVRSITYWTLNIYGEQKEAKYKDVTNTSHSSFIPP